MTNAAKEFNSALELSLVNGMTEITRNFVKQFDYAKIDELIIPEHITHIGKDAFLFCDSLIYLQIPNNVTIIDEYAFAHCTRLKVVTIPNSVKRIKRGAFINCWDLEKVIISENVRRLGPSTFANCWKLKDLIFIGKTIEEIPDLPCYPWGLPKWGPSRKIIVQVS